MKASFRFRCLLLGFWMVALLPLATPAQGTGTLKGVVKLEGNNEPLHKVKILIVQLGRSAETDETGSYQFTQLPPGTYDVVAQLPAIADERRRVEVQAGGTATLDFVLRLSVLHEQIVVTAGGREQSALETFQAVNVQDALELAQAPQTSLGAALDGEPGVAKRSFGPGTGRPVIRGFDGDRVLIMKDGISTGTLSSQSGDHGEMIDVLNLERLEVVKGPATLLYGANAIGGVVNAISSHGEVHQHPHSGLSGYVAGLGGSANGLGGGGAGFEYGIKNWLLWADGGGNRSGDYDTPIGAIFNSGTRLANTGTGAAWYGKKAFWSAGYGYENGRYGIPPTGDEVVQLALRRHSGRFTGGFRELDSWVTSFRMALDYSDYEHKELEVEPDGTETLGTLFRNKVLNYRGVFEQKRAGRLTGQFGFSGQHRDYTATGAEAIAPPVQLNNIAFFTLQEAALERLRFQFGGRVDHTAYAVQAGAPQPDRSFTGFSGAAGMHLPLWKGGAFVVNYTHSYRAPALEELYNNGPHPGNATFEIGNSNLDRERSDGLDLSVRHQSGRIRAEGNFFNYFIRGFVFLAPTGETDEEGGLPIAEYLQAKSRYLGGEANLGLGLVKDVLWLNLGLDVVNAELRSAVTTVTTGLVVPSETPLPRIPPVRGRVGFDFRYKGLRVRPEAVMARDQERLFTNETRTAGYTVFNLGASYTVARQHVIHVLSLNAFNLGDRLYRNHLSFIKDLAPEIGAGVRFGYTVRFF